MTCGIQEMTTGTGKLAKSPLGEIDEIEIRPLEIGQDGSAFRTLNEEWISRYFVLEKKDRETLGDPENAILRKGGQIFLAHAEGRTVGCVALIPMGDSVYELSKMAVSPSFQGRGIGRKLLEHAIAQARNLGAKSLFLGSNSVLKSALHLYEAVGFRHVPPENLPEMHYARADVFMEMPL
jgi:putative acetyltransferase